VDTTSRGEADSSFRACHRIAITRRSVRPNHVHHVAGVGSCGRRRFALFADWCGGRIAREAKELTPSAWTWEQAASGTVRHSYQAITSRAVRAADPFLQVHGNWVIRRSKADEKCLLRSMGFETANVHLGSGREIAAVAKDLKRRRAKWLFNASKDMARVTRNDWSEVKSNGF